MPAPPVNVTATPQNAKALVRWEPPPYNGGQPISGYTVLTSPSGLAVSVDGSQRSATVIGLTNGVLYSFAVVASNVVGSSSPSLYSDPVRPAQPPSVP
ncbi:MAG TPA: fibronectin type III domain-containing protein, partial [Myxococcaceae bacterium]|nr:fibronectin type III domain-containing protein [Myxococcaceae bacterium]